MDHQTIKGRQQHAAARPFLLIILLALAGLACNLTGGGPSDAAPIEATPTAVTVPTTPAALVAAPATASPLPPTTGPPTARPTLTNTLPLTATPQPPTNTPPPTFITATSQPQAPPTFVTATPQALPTAIPLACNDVIEAAILRIDDICAGTHRNEACYGHDQVTVDWQPGASGEFNQPSHRVALANLRRLNTGPYDPADAADPLDDRWGIALLRIQADLPDALPGQAITVLAYGDATIEDATAPEATGSSRPMQAVTIQTGFSSPTCADAPDPGILIQNDTGEVASLTVNGVDILVGSTVLIQAEPGRDMTMGVLEGRVDALALGERVSAAAGMQIRVGMAANLRPSRVPRLEQLDLSRLTNGRLQALLNRLPTRVTLPQALDLFPQLEPLIPRRPGLLQTRRAPRPTATPLPPRPTSPPAQSNTTRPTEPNITPTLPPLLIVTLPPLRLLPTATPTLIIIQQIPLVVTLEMLVVPTPTPVPLY